MRKLALFVFCTLLVQVNAQTTAATMPTRFQFGDDAHWADPDLDDSQWPIAEAGRVPSRPRERGGFVWVRMRVPVEKDVQAPLAIQVSGLGFQAMAWQVYVNGLAVGGEGTFPPKAQPIFVPHPPVTNLPQALSLRGSTAVVAIREWYNPSVYLKQDSTSPSVSIGNATLLRVTDEATKLRSMLYSLPVFAVLALLALVGVLMLVLWRRTGNRESLWSGTYLISNFYVFIGYSLSSSPHVSWQTAIWINVLTQGVNMPVALEFSRALFHLRSRAFRWVGHIGWLSILGGGTLAALVLGSPIAFRIGSLPTSGA